MEAANRSSVAMLAQISALERMVGTLSELVALAPSAAASDATI